ncbi:MAG: hypothetical protein ACK42F_10020 [Sphingobacteriales bacterium]
MSGKTLLITGAHGLVGQYIFKLRAQWSGRIISLAGGNLDCLLENIYMKKWT